MRPLRSLSTLAYLTTAWGVVFAIVHFYWAAGGELGMNGEPADTVGAQVYIAFVAVLGLAGAAVAYALRALPRRRPLVLLARAGGLALLFGVAFGTSRWLVEGSLSGDGAAGVATTAYFLVGGVLFARLGWRSPAPQRLVWS